MPDRIWNAAEYTRLSRDDGDKAESNSITSQKEIIRDYVRRHPEFVIVKEYADRQSAHAAVSVHPRPPGV